MNRKAFLRYGTLATVALAPVTRLKAWPRIGGGGWSNNDLSGVVITKVEPFVFRRACYVRIESSEGKAGWGECDSDYPELIGKVVEKICAPEILGKDPFQSEYLWMQMYFKGFDAGNVGLLPGAIAGVDNALWDLKGKLLGVPTYRLLGGADRSKVQVYASFGRTAGGGFRSPEEMARIAADFVGKGYPAVKVRMQIRQLNVDPDPDPTFETIRAVRQAIGDDIPLFVDFNNGYSPANAIVMARRLIEHFNIAVLEEPVSQQDYRGLAQVVEALDIPVMAGEHEYNKWAMRDLITIANVDYINADVIKCGGITECRKVAAMAHAFEKPVMTHNARPTLATAANLQLVASLSNAARYQEYAGPRPELGLLDLFENYFEFADGHLLVPQMPGFGLIPDEAMMKKQKLN